jgi:hypothetical protein
MPSPELGPGEDWQKQFRKVVVSAGPLKGARYPEVSQVLQTKGSQVLQTRSQVLPICEEDDE